MGVLLRAVPHCPVLSNGQKDQAAIDAVDHYRGAGLVLAQLACQAISSPTSPRSLGRSGIGADCSGGAIVVQLGGEQLQAAVGADGEGEAAGLPITGLAEGEPCPPVRGDQGLLLAGLPHRSAGSHKGCQP